MSNQGKIIIVDKDAYLLQLSRYIHRNPIETKKPMVTQLESYPWSSYSAYINEVKRPEWLTTELIHRMLGAKQIYHGYAKYVAKNNSEELIKFYSKGNYASVIGDKEFVSWYREELIPEVKESQKIKQTSAHGLSMREIVLYTAKYYEMTPSELKKLKRGKKTQSKHRHLAIFLSQELGAHRLSDIADYFGYSHIGSVSHSTCKMRKLLKDDGRLRGDVERLTAYIIDNAT